ncbi:YARHG domain-containing protein [Marinigracilibium pacificum]|uniref:YARHG domain-containing protein n=1 Tax=Marinigracilibium pacificum TaxID=2729599 RepID=A0A848IS94_9BACT|nr:YARHG domain-containing protein [Marinigracilibium pacificum]NMM47323.1 YARHG domain-containing protein [Marinigracilibium pacificum]
MNTNRLFFYFIVLLSIISCDSTKSEKTNTEKVAQSNQNEYRLVTVEKEKSTIEKSTDFELDSITFHKRVQYLNSLYGRAPYYVLTEKSVLFYITDQPSKYSSNTPPKYGLATDSLDLVLNLKYETIGNPNQLLKNCMEINTGNLYGIFNYSTFEVLDPDFDFFIPDENSAKEHAYGFKNGRWYKIEFDNLNSYYEVEYDPSRYLSNFQINNNSILDNLIYSTYNYGTFKEKQIGKGDFVLPSFLVRMNIYGQKVMEDVTNPGQHNGDYGIEHFNIETTEENPLSIGEKIKAFVVKFQESGIDARGYSINQSKLLIQNTDNNIFNSIILSNEDGLNAQCNDYDFKLVTDTLLQVKSNTRAGSTIFNDTNYRFYSIDETGEITLLESSRKYDFTKFVEINDSYFTGCFYSVSQFSKPDEYGGSTYIKTKHLSINDLDLMRNEIFAEYGYKFKTSFWKEYFKEQSWYVPLHDNVDSLLTDLDRKNIELILLKRNEMNGKEDEFTKPEQVFYHAAG